MPRWPLVLVLLLVTCASVFHALTTSLALSSDPACYLNYGKIIARGRLTFDFPAANIVFEHGRTFPESVFHGYVRATREGRLYPVVGVGYPLLLAAVIRVLGPIAAVGANMALFPFLLLLYSLLILRSLPEQERAARNCVPLLTLLYVLWALRDHLASWVMPYRELASALAGFSALVLLLAPSGRHRILRAAAGGLLLGISCLIRETGIMLLPAALSVLFLQRPEVSGEVRPRRNMPAFALACALTLLCLAAAYLPQIVVNRIQRGQSLTGQFDIVFSPFVRTSSAAVQPEADPRSSGLEMPARRVITRDVAGSLPQRLKYLATTALPVTPFFFIGLAFCLRRGFGKFASVHLVSAAVYILGLSVLVRPGRGNSARYELIIFLFLIPIAALGAVKTGQWIGRRIYSPRIRNVPGLAMAILVLIYCATRGVSVIQPQNRRPFSFGDLAVFQKQAESSIPAGAIVFAETPARDFFQYLTGANAVSLYDMMNIGNLTVREIVESAGAGSIRLFFARFPNPNLREMPYTIEEVETVLRNEADLTPVHVFDLKELHMSSLFGAEELGLFEIVPAARTEAVLPIPPDYAEPARLTVRLGRLPPDITPSIVFAGNELKGALILNRIFMCEIPALTPQPSPEILVRAGAGLPQSLSAEIAPLSSAVCFRFGLNGSELPWLGTGWVSGKNPRIRQGCRIMPEKSSLRLASFAEFEGGSAEVYLGFTPVSPDKVAVTCGGSSGDSFPARLCIDGNGLADGILVGNWPVAEELFLKDASETGLEIHTLALGQSAGTVTVPALASGVKPELWRVLSIPSAESEPVRQIAVVQALLHPASARQKIERHASPPLYTQSRVVVGPEKNMRYMLVEKIDAPDFASFRRSERSPDVKARSATLSWTCLSGFYPPETDGRWIGPNARIIIPPVPNGCSRRITIEASDLRPAAMAPTRVEVMFHDRTLYSDEITTRNGETVISFVLEREDSVAGPEPDAVLLDVTPWRPCEAITGSEDVRLLGLFIRSVRVEPVPDPEA